MENAAGQDFVAIPLGDVNYSWTPSAASLPLAEYPMSAKTSGPKVSASSPLLAAAASGSLPEVIFQISRHTNQPKDLLTAQVNVSNCRQVTSAQFTLVWDPEVLRFLTTGDYGIRGLSAANFNTRMTDKGHLAFSWNDPQALGITMADGTPEFKISFEVIGNAGDISPLELVDSITEREVGVNFARAPFRAQNGDVTVVSPALAQSPRPTLTRAASVTNAFSLSLPTSTGLHYTLEYANILPTTTWKALFSVLGDGANKTLTDPSPPSQQRFYRVRIE